MSEQKPLSLKSFDPGDGNGVAYVLDTTDGPDTKTLARIILNEEGQVRLMMLIEQNGDNSVWASWPLTKESARTLSWLLFDAVRITPDEDQEVPNPTA